MDKEKKSEIHITNNFNAPIGQHIDHVDTINFRMDGDGNFHFGMVENVKEGKQKANSSLPQELKSEEAISIFNKGIEKGLIISQGDTLKWTGNKRLLAYFAEKMCQHFNLSNKQDKDGNDTVSWKPFEQLFDIKNLKSAKQAFMQLNTRFEPEGFESVDSLFD